MITVTFDDGSTCVGGLLVACDGSNSRVRKALFPELAQENLYRIPIAVMGVKMQLSTVQIAGMREQDAYFLQGTSSENDSFVYMSGRFCPSMPHRCNLKHLLSEKKETHPQPHQGGCIHANALYTVLDAPGNSPDNPPDSYNLQICLSWPYRDGYLGREKQVCVPDTQEDRRKLFLEFAASYAEPFRSVMGAITDDTEIRTVDLSDWPPPKGLHTTGNAVLMGDSLHHMAMCKSPGSCPSPSVSNPLLSVLARNSLDGESWKGPGRVWRLLHGSAQARFRSFGGWYLLCQASQGRARCLAQRSAHMGAMCYDSRQDSVDWPIGDQSILGEFD